MAMVYGEVKIQKSKPDEQKAEIFFNLVENGTFEKWVQNRDASMNELVPFWVEMPEPVDGELSITVYFNEKKDKGFTKKFINRG